YAPAIVADFGSVGARIDVRAVAPYGAAAYRQQLAADLRVLRPVGTQIRVTAYAGRAVRAGSAPRTRSAARFGPRRAAPFGYARPDRGPFARAGKQPLPAGGRPGRRRPVPGLRSGAGCPDWRPGRGRRTPRRKQAIAPPALR